MFHAQATLSPVIQPPEYPQITNAMMWTKKVLLEAFLLAPCFLNKSQTSNLCHMHKSG